jgi:hypothetical protein
MKTEAMAVMLIEMAAGIVLGFVIWSYVAPALAGSTSTTA